MAVSQEYLEEIWQLAKKTLPGWAYATLHAQAKAIAGGRGAHRATTPNALETLGMGCMDEERLREIDKTKLSEIWAQLDQWYLGAVRKKTSPDKIIEAAKAVSQKMNSLGMAIKPSALSSRLVSVDKSLVPLAFVGACPDSSEDFVKTLVTKYIHPLNLSESDWWLFDLIPEEVPHETIDENITKWGEWSSSVLNNTNPGIVVALGKTARKVLGDKADFSLPHPMAITKFHDSGELGRKLKQIRKKLSEIDNLENKDTVINNTPSDTGDTPAERNGRTTGGWEMYASIAKSDSTKQIVYGIVMDSYGASGTKPDAHNDYIPPATIEEAAHKFLLGDRVIGRQHETKTNAQVVESWVEMYPTPAEYKKAIDGLDHKVYRRKFGTDVVHSGAWILGVRLGDVEWKAFESGELNAFSPGGVGYRQRIDASQMPKVEFIDLVEKADG